ncbi:MAG: hypothetical protein ACR2M0_12810 [Chloroflexia bacterium]
MARMARYIQDVECNAPTLADLDVIEADITARAASLVIIDTLTAYLPPCRLMSGVEPT